MHRSKLTILGLGLGIAVGLSSQAAAQISCSEPEASWILCEDFESGAFDNPPWRDSNLAAGSSALLVQSGVVASGTFSGESRSIAGSSGSLWASHGFADHPLWAEGISVEEVYLSAQIRFTDLSGGQRMLTMYCFEDWSAGYGEPNGWSPYFAQLQFRNTSEPTQARELEGVMYRKDGTSTITRSLLPNLATVQLQTDRWYEVEYHMLLNTPGASNGVFEVWIDGTKIIEYSNVNYRGSYTQLGWNQLMIGTSVGHSPSQSIFFDDVVVSEERIGSDPVGMDGGVEDGGVDDGGVDPDGGAEPRCGNGIPEGDEECDDGNAKSGDACLNSCQAARCGDGIVHQGHEVCDYGADPRCSDDCLSQTPTTDLPRSNRDSVSGGCALSTNPGATNLVSLALGMLLLLWRRRLPAPA